MYECARPGWGSLEVDSMSWWLAGGGVNVVKSCLGRFQCCDKVVASTAFVPIGKAPLGMSESQALVSDHRTAREIVACATVRWMLPCLFR